MAGSVEAVIISVVFLVREIVFLTRDRKLGKSIVLSLQCCL